uniref:C-type lectin domain-containing protein n=1 Tax=Onchocerca volvulus TaxID=6282 RepID=A0A2K6VPS8_ONCVO
MSGAVVLIVFLVAVFSSVHCSDEVGCERDFYIYNSYCYKMIVVKKPDTIMDEKLKNISITDKNICREMSPMSSPTFSISIRNKEEFEFVKQLYKHFDLPLRAYPLLIGLTYKNNNFYWSDDSPFDYDGFLDVAYEEKLSVFRKNDFSPRRFYSFDISCNALFQNYLILCRYQLHKIPKSGELLPEVKDSRLEGLDKTQSDYYDYNYDYGQ